MSFGRALPAAILGVAVAACGSSQSAAPAAPPEVARSAAIGSTGAEAIDPESLLARISFLASDALQGRGTPSPGLEAAAAYLASEHRRMGLEPAGDDGSYMQRYPLNPSFGSGGEPTYAPNVVALLPGSDLILRDEYVVLSAHFDHLGIGGAVAGDSVYNGADDNGSGNAALLEIAGALASLPRPPRRSVVFLHVSGEEQGLLGSSWFVEHPTIPADRIVANINVDMIGRNSPDSIVVIGKDYSSLGEIVERVGQEHPELALTISDDLWPEERFFYRSDHYNFARSGIPALFFFAGVHEDYHEPSDEVEEIDGEKAARVARLIFHAVREIANAEERPEWSARGRMEVR